MLPGKLADPLKRTTYLESSGLKTILKLNKFQEISNYRNHLITFARFLGVGLSGIVVNLVILWLLVGASIVPFMASLLATEISIIWNFFLHDYWTFKSQKVETSNRSAIFFQFTRFLRFQLVSSLGAVLSIGLFFSFNTGLHLFYLLAQIGAIGLTTIINFTLNAWFTWNWFKRTSPSYVKIDQLTAENTLDIL